MIAVITSTIRPAENKSYYSYKERLEQTIGTLNSLQRTGFSKIYLIDNSPDIDIIELQNLLKDFADLTVFHIEQYQFNNKGINEIMMLLYVCRHLPANQPIFKISGRYIASADFVKPAFNDIAVKGYHFSRKNGTISTRGYWIKNAGLLKAFLEDTLREVFAYPERIVGLRSLFNKITRPFNTQNNPVNISIEFAAANVLKHSKYDITFLAELNIEGLIAGSDNKEKIVE